MNEADVLVIGAGACGLMAARELSKAGKKVIVLEARHRVGGRIHTLKNEGFSMPVEAGAEFVHGDLPLTLSLLEAANISFYHREGEIYRVEDGTPHQTSELIKDFDLLLSRLKELKKDMSFKEFLLKYFKGDEYEDLRESATAFAEGYDTARVEKLSAASLRDEWTSEGVTHPYLLQDGYGQLVNFIAGECTSRDCKIHLSAVVKEINWKRGHAEVITADQKRYAAPGALITVPVGVLQSEPAHKAYIRFSPALPRQHENSLRQLGYGNVIKIMLELKNSFWDDEASVHDALQLPRLGFLLSKEEVPVWWTQLPGKRNLLTGWIGGPKADELKNIDDGQLLQKAVSSLCAIFKTSREFLKEQITASYVANWSNDPFSQGAYSYTTVRSKEAISILKEPLEDTIYFAGEALQLENVGTVEAALVSGKEAAENMMRQRIASV